MAQYREERDTRSLHMLVYADGRFVIDHFDEANPERGRILDHAVKDVAPTLLRKLGRWVADHKTEIAVVGGTALTVTALAAAARRR